MRSDDQIQEGFKWPRDNFNLLVKKTWSPLVTTKVLKVPDSPVYLVLSLPGYWLSPISSGSPSAHNGGIVISRGVDSQPRAGKPDPGAHPPSSSDSHSWLPQLHRVEVISFQVLESET